MSAEYSYLELRFQQCNQVTQVCRPQTEMDSYFNDLVISTIYVDSLLDFKDFHDSPIHRYLEEPVLVQLDADF
jgi:hypothetical protein